jgi:hypothetical protein
MKNSEIGGITLGTVVVVLLAIVLGASTGCPKATEPADRSASAGVAPRAPEPAGNAAVQQKEAALRVVAKSTPPVKAQPEPVAALQPPVQKPAAGPANDGPRVDSDAVRFKTVIESLDQICQMALETKKALLQAQLAPKSGSRNKSGEEASNGGS